MTFWTKICNVQRMEIDVSHVTDREDSRCFGNGQLASRPSRLVTTKFTVVVAAAAAERRWGCFRI